MKQILAFLVACGVGLAGAQEAEAPAVGSTIQMPTLKDLHYADVEFKALGEHPFHVLYFFANTCPVAQRYMGAMIELEKTYAPQGVKFSAINVSPADTILDTAQTALDYGVTFTVLKDMSGDSAKALGITRTPEIALLDKEMRLLYRGRVNDQFRLGGVRPRPTREDLREALDEVLSGKPVSTPTTKAEGCAITYPPVPKPSDPVTFVEHMLPIFSKCTGCHKEGGMAPFPLRTIDDVRERSEHIVEVITTGKMPPWHAASEHGHFANDTRLSEKEKLLVQQWLAGGMEGQAGTAIPTEGAINPDSLLKAPQGSVIGIGSTSRKCTHEELIPASITALGATGENITGYQITATLADGEEETLLSVPAYDAEWPIQYKLAEPRQLPEGSKLNVIMHSPTNPEGKLSGRIKAQVFHGE